MSTMKLYKCNQCGKIVERGKRKGRYPAWMLSYCEGLGKMTRLYLQKKASKK